MADVVRPAKGKVLGLTQADRKELRASAKDEAWALQEASRAALADSVGDLAAREELRLSDFMAITGALPEDEREIYQLDSAGVHLHSDYKIARSAFEGHPLVLQVEVTRQDEAGLRFPFTPNQLLEFVDHGQIGGEFSVSTEFREAVENQQSTSAPQPKPTGMQRADGLARDIEEAIGQLEAQGTIVEIESLRAQLATYAGRKNTSISRTSGGLLYFMKAGVETLLENKTIGQRLYLRAKRSRND